MTSRSPPLIVASMLSNQRNLLLSWLFALLLLSPGGRVAAEIKCDAHWRPANKLSTAQIRAEISVMLALQKDIRLYKQVEGEIRFHSRCNSYWKRMVQAKGKYNQLKSKVIASRELAMYKRQGQAARERYRTCFTLELKKHPKIYKRKSQQAKTFEQFAKNLQLMEQRTSECMFQKRAKVLKTELLNRGVIKNKKLKF